MGPVPSRLPASRVLALLRWAGDDSPIAASISGGPQFVGWGIDRLLAKQNADVVTQLAFGLAGKRAEETIPVPRKEAR